MRNKKGFTLPEVLMVSVVLILVLTATTSIYMMMSQYVKKTIVQASLQSEARVAIEKMARNTREASAVTCSVSGDMLTLDFTAGRVGLVGSDWNEEYILTGGEIRHFPDTTQLDYTVIAENVNLDAGDQLFFDAGNGLVTIDLKMTSTVFNTQQKVHLATIVKKRNEN